MAVDQRSAIEREIRVEARPETVFEFFTDPEKMTRWMGREAEIDPRPGGAYRIDIVGHVAVGEYVEIDRPHRLVMTWTFGDDPSNVQLIELSLSESEGSTTVLLVNSGISTDERRGAQDWGWRGCLDELDRALAGP